MCQQLTDSRTTTTLPQPQTWPATQVYALTRNPNSDPLGLLDKIHPTEPHQSGQDRFLDSHLKLVTKKISTPLG